MVKPSSSSALSTALATDARQPGTRHVSSPLARTSWPWRLAAVIAVGAQVVSAICGVLLLFYWVAASIALGV